MSTILVDPDLHDEELRTSVYKGGIVFRSPSAATTALCDLAWRMIQEAFGSLDPEHAQFEMPVERYSEILAKLKPDFTHHPEAKRHLRDIIEETGADPGDVYFDVPKLRIVTSDEYLTAGMGYAYKAHRDIWYACPPCQINWWTPIRPIDARCGLVFYPSEFGRPVDNNSGDFDAYRWNADGRKNAAKFVKQDPRPHPHLANTSQLVEQIIVGQPASITMFSAQHLHATVPNTSGRTRFSIDFRTVHRDDIDKARGATLTDNSSTGTTLRDFMRSTDLQKFPENVVERYERGERPEDGVLVFDPNG